MALLSSNLCEAIDAISFHKPIETTYSSPNSAYTWSTQLVVYVDISLHFLINISSITCLPLKCNDFNWAHITLYISKSLLNKLSQNTNKSIPNRVWLPAKMWNKNTNIHWHELWWPISKLHKQPSNILSTNTISRMILSISMHNLPNNCNYKSSISIFVLSDSNNICNVSDCKVKLVKQMQDWRTFLCSLMVLGGNCFNDISNTLSTRWILQKCLVLI